MKSPSFRVLLTAALVLLPCTGCKKAKQIAAQTAGSVGISEPTYADAIHAAVDSSHMDELRWPNLSDVQQPVAAFYDNRQYTLAWSKNGKPTKQADGIMQAISNAHDRGLEPEDYDASRWQARVNALGTDEGKIAFDTAMTVNAARFLNAIHMGRTDPQYFAFGVKNDEKQLDLPTVLESQLSSASDVDEILTSFEPQGAQYKALKEALKHYRALADRDHSDALPEITGSASVALNARYPALPALAAKLQLAGDLSGGPSGEVSQETSTAPVDVSAVVDALKHYQARHGQDQSGKLTASTVAALNTPMSTRVAEIEDAMERWRWLSDEYQKPAVLVNLPEFELRAYEGGEEAFRMRVVDGQSSKDEHHTPMIADHIRYLVLRPYWNLPPDIAKKELLPHMEKDPGYLSAHNYEVVNNKGEEQPASFERIAHGGLMVRQKPGPKNSLGLVKFMFPNQFNVYLHDTDAHSLFDRTRRDYSHGCVRVQDPPKLADWLLRDKPEWDADKIQETMNDEEVTNKTVSLNKPVPIVLFYGTAYVDNGEIHFFKDLYGYDDDLEKALKKGPPYPRKPAKLRAEASV